MVPELDRTLLILPEKPLFLTGSGPDFVPEVDQKSLI